MYDVNKFDYSPWYSGNGPDITSNNNEPSIRRIQEKITAMKGLMDYYREQYEIIYEPENLVNITDDNKEFLNTLNADITQLAEEINMLINKVLVNDPKNKALMERKVSTLLKKNDNLQNLYGDIMVKQEELNTLDASYHDTHTKSESNFYIYLYYFFLVVFIFGSLLYILKNPQDGNLDMFILGLGIIIFAYYIYDYYFVK
jgi:hypothetical protein